FVPTQQNSMRTVIRPHTCLPICFSWLDSRIEIVRSSDMAAVPRPHGIDRPSRARSFPLPTIRHEPLLARCGLSSSASFVFAHPGRPLSERLPLVDLAPHALASCAGRDHVGGHASRSMRLTVCPRRAPRVRSTALTDRPEFSLNPPPAAEFFGQ